MRSQNNRYRMSRHKVLCLSLALIRDTFVLYNKYNKRLGGFVSYKICPPALVQIQQSLKQCKFCLFYKDCPITENWTMLPWTLAISSNRIDIHFLQLGDFSTNKTVFIAVKIGDGCFCDSLKKTNHIIWNQRVYNG